MLTNVQLHVIIRKKKVGKETKRWVGVFRGWGVHMKYVWPLDICTVNSNISSFSSSSTRLVLGFQRQKRNPKKKDKKCWETHIICNASGNKLKMRGRWRWRSRPNANISYTYVLRVEKHAGRAVGDLYFTYRHNSYHIHTASKRYGL